MLKQMHCCSCSKDNTELLQHPLLKVPTCVECCNTYNTCDFKLGYVGRNFLNCSWCCGGAGELVHCETCPRSFCTKCIARNFGNQEIILFKCMKQRWKCYCCDPRRLVDLCTAHNWDPGQRKCRLNYKGDKIVLDDVSMGREAFEIPAVNEHNNDVPDSFRYVTSFVFDEKVDINTNPEYLSCCNCLDNCSSMACACQQKTGNISYDHKGILNRSHPFGVFECNQRCTCYKSQCKNRIVTQGPLLPLEVFHCNDGRGWGVRCRVDIPSGTFVADYLGEILPESLVDARGKSRDCDGYLYALDHWGRNEAHWKAASLGLVEDRSDPSRQPAMKATSASANELLKYLDEDLVSRLVSSGAVERAHSLGQHIINSPTMKQDTLNDWMRGTVGRASNAMDVMVDTPVEATYNLKSPAKQVIYSVPINKYFSGSSSSSSSVTEPSSSNNSCSSSSSESSSRGSMSNPNAVHQECQELTEMNWATKEAKARTLLLNEAKHKLVERTLEERDEAGEQFTVDARWYGNVGRFINHSCDPNLDKISVYCETRDVRLNRVGFFTNGYIKAYTELCYDYCYYKGDVEGKTLKCLCGSTKCRGVMY